MCSSVAGVVVTLAEGNHDVFGSSPAIASSAVLALDVIYPATASDCAFGALDWGDENKMRAQSLYIFLTNFY